jgi:hypothetical protein
VALRFPPHSKTQASPFAGHFVIVVNLQLIDLEAAPKAASFWSAPAERSGDRAFDRWTALNPKRRGASLPLIFT